MDRKTPELITRARVLNLPPHVVYEELKTHAEHLEKFWHGTDEKLEAALFAKEDPLINLGLAQFGGSREIAAQLYKRSFALTGDPSYNRALRLASLSNRLLPAALFAGDFGAVETHELARLALQGESDEINAMLTNPSAKKLIANLYNRKPPFDKVPLDRFIAMVRISHANPCINEDESDEHGPDFTAWDLKNGIWSMVKALPVTEDALDALYWLLCAMDPRRTGLAGEDPMPVFKRWGALQLSEKFKKYHRGREFTDLEYQQEFVVLLAAHYHAYSDDQVRYVGGIEAPDLFLRCAHYSHAGLTIEQMQTAYNRDADAFTLAALFNDTLYWDQGKRAKLEHFIRGDLIGLYRQRCEQIHRRQPSFETKPVSEDGALVLEDTEKQPTEEQKRLERLEAQLVLTGNRLKSLSSLAQWTLILLIVVLVLVGRADFF